MKVKTYIVGIGRVGQQHHTRTVTSTGKRQARWNYVNLWAPRGTRYSDTSAVERGSK